jgi:hypothetical protein
MSEPHELPPATTDDAAPVRPHPVDVALAAISQMAGDLLGSDKPNRFGEIRSITSIAMQLQRMRPDVGVSEIGDHEDYNDAPVMMRRGQVHGGGFNDAADVSREILMMAQTFITQYAEAEKRKADKPDPDVRLNEVGELAELYMLRLKLAGADQDIPPEINYRISHLLKRIGEPSHEPDRPQWDPALSPEHVRGCQVDGSGGPDRGGVGADLAERAGGDDGARQEVQR